MGLADFWGPVLSLGEIDQFRFVSGSCLPWHLCFRVGFGDGALHVSLSLREISSRGHEIRDGPNRYYSPSPCSGTRTKPVVFWSH